MSMSLFKSPPLVKEAHQDEEEHLIGDNSKMCCLPVLKGGHHKSISAQTVCLCCVVHAYTRTQLLHCTYVLL